MSMFVGLKQNKIRAKKAEFVLFLKLINEDRIWSNLIKKVMIKNSVFTFIFFRLRWFIPDSWLGADHLMDVLRPFL